MIIGVASVCDFCYTIYQGVSKSTDVTPAKYQYMSPAVLLVSMVSIHVEDRQCCCLFEQR